jgi:hypothetical protein
MMSEDKVLDENRIVADNDGQHTSSDVRLFLSFKTEVNKLHIMLFILQLGLGVYYRWFLQMSTIEIGDNGSLFKVLMLSISMVAGKSLIFISIYGLLLSIIRQKESKFKRYYIISSVIILSASLIYFLVR